MCPKLLAGLLSGTPSRSDRPLTHDRIGGFELHATLTRETQMRLSFGNPSP